jgi:hypothetical protein
MSNSHRPVIPDDDNPSLFEALFRFIPMIFLYAVRHLTIGTMVRRRLKKLEQKGEKWIVEDNLN